MSNETDVPESARQLAGRIAEAFGQDQALAKQKNSCPTGCGRPTASCGRGFTPTRWA